MYRGHSAALGEKLEGGGGVKLGGQWRKLEENSLTTKNTTRVTMLRAVMSDIVRRAPLQRSSRDEDNGVSVCEEVEWLTLSRFGNDLRHLADKSQTRDRRWRSRTRSRQCSDLLQTRLSVQPQGSNASAIAYYSSLYGYSGPK